MTLTDQVISIWILFIAFIVLFSTLFAEPIPEANPPLRIRPHPQLSHKVIRLVLGLAIHAPPKRAGIDHGRNYKENEAHYLP